MAPRETSVQYITGNMFESVPSANAMFFKVNNLPYVVFTYKKVKIYEPKAKQILTDYKRYYVNFEYHVISVPFN
jgi:hypothetical protein